MKMEKIICHGPTKTLRRYARLLQRQGYFFELPKIRDLTQSGVYTLQNRPDYQSLVKHLGAKYEPEIYHAVSIKRGSIHFTIYKSGKIIVTGIKNATLLDKIVYPTLLDIECC